MLIDFAPCSYLSSKLCSPKVADGPGATAQLQGTVDTSNLIKSHEMYLKTSKSPYLKHYHVFLYAMHNLKTMQQCMPSRAGEIKASPGRRLGPRNIET